MSDEKCDKCGKVGVNLITVTDHPHKHDGRYCNYCNPYGAIVHFNKGPEQADAEKAAREYAQSWTTLKDGTRIPAGIIHNKLEAFLVGVEWERKRSASKLLAALDKFANWESKSEGE